MRILTAFNLICLGAWIAMGVGTLGDFERPLRDHVLFRDGSTTLTGTLTGTDGMSLKIPSNGRITVTGIVFNPITVATETELKDYLQNYEMCLWMPGGSPIAMVLRRGDKLEIHQLDKYEDRIPGEWYHYAIEIDSDLYLLRARPVFF